MSIFNKKRTPSRIDVNVVDGRGQRVPQCTYGKAISGKAELEFDPSGHPSGFWSRHRLAF